MKLPRLSLFVLVLCVVAAGSAGAQVKDDPPPTIGIPPNAVGGPDAFGYTWADQAEANCAFNYVDITGSGAAQGHGDDDQTSVAIGGPGFDFYGGVVGTVGIVSNGWLDMAASGDTDFTNDCPVPNGATPNDAIFGYWDDLDPGDDAFADAFWEYFASCPRPGRSGAVPGCNIFQWSTCHFSGPCAVAGVPEEDFQVILYDNWDFVVQVQTTTEGGSGSTTGMENATGTDGLAYACDSGGIAAGTAVCFFHPLAVAVDLQDIEIE